jgi:hypothetical protein
MDGWMVSWSRHTPSQSVPHKHTQPKRKKIKIKIKNMRLIRVGPEWNGRTVELRGALVVRLMHKNTPSYGSIGMYNTRESFQGY